VYATVATKHTAQTKILITVSWYVRRHKLSILGSNRKNECISDPDVSQAKKIALSGPDLDQDNQSSRVRGDTSSPWLWMREGSRRPRNFPKKTQDFSPIGNYQVREQDETEFRTVWRQWTYSVH
jgi:hypothetical protein